jgi:hypothetical protein
VQMGSRIRDENKKASAKDSVKIKPEDYTWRLYPHAIQDGELSAKWKVKSAEESQNSE